MPDLVISDIPLTKSSVRCDSGEVRHDRRQGPLRDGIEMPPTGEWFERKAHRFHPFADAVMTEDLDLDPTRL